MAYVSEEFKADAETKMPQQLELQPFKRLAPDEYRYCSRCRTPVLLKQIKPLRPGLKALSFECRKCRSLEEIITPSGVVGRLRIKTLNLKRVFLKW